jgi:hypothetical protein
VYLVLRVDLDYVPWDTPDAKEFGHSEPATLLRMLEVARKTGYKYHFFASIRVLRAFPAAIEALLGEGHELDWYCKDPLRLEELHAEAKDLGHRLDQTLQGLSVKGEWPAEAPEPGPLGLRFLSARAGAEPESVRMFPVQTHGDREGVRAGQSMRLWADEVRAKLRDSAMLNRGETLVFRPQVLGKVDPNLRIVREIIELGLAVGLRNRTLRDLVAESA